MAWKPGKSGRDGKENVSSHLHPSRSSTHTDDPRRSRHLRSLLPRGASASGINASGRKKPATHNSRERSWQLQSRRKYARMAGSASVPWRCRNYRYQRIVTYFAPLHPQDKQWIDSLCRCEVKLLSRTCGSSSIPHNIPVKVKA